MITPPAYQRLPEAGHQRCCWYHWSSMRQHQQPWPTASTTLMESAVSSSLIRAGRGISISIFTTDKDVVEVKATFSDPHLGDDDFDSHLVSIFMDEFFKKHQESIRQGHGAVWRLREACEVAKWTPTSSMKATVSLDCL